MFNSQPVVILMPSTTNLALNMHRKWVGVTEPRPIIALVMMHLIKGGMKGSHFIKYAFGLYSLVKCEYVTRHIYDNSRTIDRCQ